MRRPGDDRRRLGLGLQHQRRGLGLLHDRRRLGAAWSSNEGRLQRQTAAGCRLPKVARTEEEQPGPRLLIPAPS